MSDRSDAEQNARPASIVLIEQSGAKRQIPQPSAGTGMRRAEQAIRRHGRHLREVKVVARNRAVARWKSDELRWRRVA